MFLLSNYHETDVLAQDKKVEPVFCAAPDELGKAPGFEERQDEVNRPGSTTQIDR